MAKKSDQSGIPSQEVCPQVERYPGSDVIGMEYTTARPMSFETGADPQVYLPGKPSTYFCRETMNYKSTTDGKRPVDQISVLEFIGRRLSGGE